MKKRTLIVVALAIVLALSFATVATAKYAGYAYNNPLVLKSGGTTITATPGYLSWDGASQLNIKNGRAHGGYVTSTVKCAVCHSVHRAYSAAATTSSYNYTDMQKPEGAANQLLTTGNSCANCHANYAAGSAGRKIEWASSSAGPHSSFDCMMQCHDGGIHGGNESKYHGNNIYMLGTGLTNYPSPNGEGKDALLTTAFANGNGLSTQTGAPDTVAQDWFLKGTTAPPSTGGKPDGLTVGQFTQAKATATGYTCAQGGCHDASQFAVNTWGYSEMRKKAPGGNTDADNLTAFTGHRTNAGSGGSGNNSHVGASCGPCHPGNAAGGYRVSNGSTVKAVEDARQYGCDQCHDMVGKATNSTAWPHGNRNITVLEWDKDGKVADKAQSSGNLWMYQGSIVGTASGSGMYDKSFKVIDGAASFNGTNTTGKPGVINDGTCLKCHVAVDAESVTTIGLTPGSSSSVYGGPHGRALNAARPSMPNQATDKAFIFLWK